MLSYRLLILIDMESILVKKQKQNVTIIYLKKKKLKKLATFPTDDGYL